MADVFAKAKRSEVMARIRGRGNKDTELALAKLLRRHDITGWRRQMEVSIQRSEARIFKVKVDFVFPKSRTAIFVDGCFWHGCPKHATKPQNNRAFWRRKFSANKARDVLVTRTLRRAGWRVLRVWEHELARKMKPGCYGGFGRRWATVEVSAAPPGLNGLRNVQPKASLTNSLYPGLSSVGLSQRGSAFISG